MSAPIPTCLPAISVSAEEKLAIFSVNTNVFAMNLPAPLQAKAFLSGRKYVIPQDVADVFLDIAKHRIVLNTKARVTKVTAEAVLSEILSDTYQPASYVEK